MRIKKQVVAAVCCTSLLTAACASFAQAKSPTIQAGSSNQETTVSEPTAEQTEAAEGQDGQAMQNDQFCIWGPVTSVQDGQITIDNQSGVSYEGEIVLNIDPDNSLVLGAENGFAVPLTDIAVGETVYAYIGQTMTMSLPPMTNANVVIAKVPADYKAPEYVTVQSMTEKDGGNWELTGTNGTTYQVSADCEILPYLTRNIVTLQDVSESRKVLVWSDAENQAQKLVLFAE